MIYTIIQSVAEKLSSLPYIEGIVLGGSRARGIHTEDSDIDIGIYYNQESFDLTAINQIATELDDENRNTVSYTHLQPLNFHPVIVIVPILCESASVYCIVIESGISPLISLDAFPGLFLSNSIVYSSYAQIV